MSTTVSLESFIKELDRWKYLTLSFVPDIPDNEVQYTLVSHSSYDTVHGTTLILNLKDNNGNPVTMSYPDIFDIAVNNSSSSMAAKYYLHCRVRLLDYKLNDLNGNTHIGIGDEEEFDEHTLKKNSKMTYRIIFTN
ncbi:hypothetical protein [Sediminibacillus sp. JSM 1682029]|uniref:hypothetical protein n=1 Tax=Sediminibacillus sp. JSM 1682029 TaxID=3229857 RepID=UPI003524EED3